MLGDNRHEPLGQSGFCTHARPRRWEGTAAAPQYDCGVQQRRRRNLQQVDDFSRQLREGCLPSYVGGKEVVHAKKSMAEPMKSFLITFKPDSENPERGWPLAELQRLVRRHELGKRTEEKWRFHNRREVSIGDRVFLLRQGKLGPAVIGYGQVVGEPEVDDGKWKTLARFESIVDPTTHVLATKA